MLTKTQLTRANASRENMGKAPLTEEQGRFLAAKLAGYSVVRLLEHFDDKDGYAGITKADLPRKSPVDKLKTMFGSSKEGD